MIFDSVFEVDSVLENKSDFLIVADSILNKRIWNNQIEQWCTNADACHHLPTTSFQIFWNDTYFFTKKKFYRFVANANYIIFNVHLSTTELPNHLIQSRKMKTSLFCISKMRKFFYKIGCILIVICNKFACEILRNTGHVLSAIRSCISSKNCASFMSVQLLPIHYVESESYQ